MLLEGMISLSNDDKRLVKTYLSSMEKYSKKLFSQNPDGASSVGLTQLLTQKSTEITKDIFPFQVYYYFNKNTSTKGSFHNQAMVIDINIAFTGEWKNKKDADLHESIYFSSLDFKKIGRFFLHEYIHYLQSLKRKEKSGDYQINPSYDKKYWDQPWEHQAWAGQYLDYLKQELNIKKPAEIVSQLKKMGVMHDTDLNSLKRSNYKAWKAVMKNAIMYALNDMKKGDKFPWQKKKLP